MMKTIFAANRGVSTACLALLLTAASCLGAGALISAGSTWKFLDTGVDQGTAWRGPGFNDSSWASGPAQFGFGDGDEVTVLRSGIVTAYFRKTFNAANPATLGNLTLRVLRDDGAAVYLNGVEVFRNNLPAGPLSFNTLATAAVGGAEETTTFLTAVLGANLLVAGENVIAAEVHQVTLTSSDLSFDLELLADDEPPLPDLPVVAVQTVDNTAAEGAADRGRLRLVRSGSTTEPLNVQVNYGGSAINGEDYVTLPTIVEIPAGSATADLEIVPIDDNLVEGTETLALSIVEPQCANENPPGPGCYRVGAPSQASASILDNDLEPPPPPPGRLTLVASNSVWKYLDNGTDQGTAWRAPNFDDSSWASGPGQFGYGDGDESTVVNFGPDPANKFITTYFRREFFVAFDTDLSNLVVNVLSDDGVVVYLNGAEVFRNNMPAGPINFNTLASSVIVDENAYVTASIPVALLASARNVIAAEVHQVNGASSDLGFDLALFMDDGTPPPPPPDLPFVSVVAVDNSASESGVDSGLFRISRTGPTTNSLLVTLAYGGSAVNGTDTLLLPPFVEIPSGSSSIDLTAVVIDDSDVEGTESFVLIVVEPPCAILDPTAPGCYRVAAAGQAVVNIVDNDSEPPPPPPGEVTLIASNSVWKYLDNGTDQGTAWSAPSFEDNSWASGPGQLGYGDGDEATVVSFGPDQANKFITTYFRRDFDVGDVSALSNLVLQVLRDDGVAVYLNGVEVFRNNLPAGPIAFNTLAVAAAPDENAYLTTPISSAVLVSGRNVMAAEVHQSSPLSSDLGFDLALFAEGTVLPPPDPCAPLPAPDDQTYPAVASDGTNFLVVWIDMRDRDSTWFDVYGARVSAAGKVLDRGGIPICTLESSAYYPAVAFDGANYLVVWSDDRDHADGNPRLEIYGARVSPGGVVLDPNGIQITHGEIAYQPTLAFNGTEYLVGAYTWEHNGYRGPTLLGVRVTPAGEVRDMEELVLHQSTFGGGYPAIVASAGGEWLVAWNGAGVEGARVSASGIVSEPQQLVNEGEAWVRSLASVGGNYFLTTVANRQLAADTYVMDVFGTWITHEGQPLTTVVIAANTNTTIGSFEQPTTYVQNHATAVANGPDVQVVWEAGAMYTNGGLFMFLSDIRSAHVGPNGDVSPVESVCAKPQDQSFAGLAFNGENFLAVWQDARTAPPEEYSPHREFDIYGARFTAGGAVIEPGGFIIGAKFPDCDSDNDGVPDALDCCPDTTPGAIVNGDGCAIAQLCPCAGPWQKHAEYMDCVITHSWEFYREGLITAAQRSAIIRQAAQSDCGRSSPRQPAARVHLLPLTPEECKRDGLRVVISRDPIGSCTIETSTDLVHWTLFRTLDSAELGSEIGCSHSVNEPSRFFRVRMETP